MSMNFGNEKINGSIPLMGNLNSLLSNLNYIPSFCRDSVEHLEMVNTAFVKRGESGCGLHCGVPSICPLSISWVRSSATVRRDILTDVGICFHVQISLGSMVE